MTYGSFLNTILVISLFVVVEGQIRCYICSTQYSDKCGDQFTMTSVDATSCDGTCLKARGFRSEGSKTVVEVNRRCVSYYPDGCRKEDYLGISADVCYCNTQLCNKADTIFLHTGLTLLTTFLILIYSL